MAKAKQKRCRQCSKLFTPYRSTDVVCSSPCYYAYNSEKAIEARFKEINKTVKDAAKLSTLRMVCKTLAQKYARLRDKSLPCISCGCETAIEWHGGHLFKAELYSGVVFDELNLAKQCKKCNVFLDGAETGYIFGFIDRYGIDKLNELRKKAQETKNYKWSKEEIQEKITYYKQQIKQITNVQQ
jgi:hypothetical protein